MMPMIVGSAGFGVELPAGWIRDCEPIVEERVMVIDRQRTVLTVFAAEGGNERPFDRETQ